MFIIKFILFLILAIALVVGFGLFRIMNKIQNNMRQFNRQANHNPDYGRNRNSESGFSSSHTNHPHEKPKIIPKDEGEYVEFTEE